MVIAVTNAILRNQAIRFILSTLRCSVPDYLVPVWYVEIHMYTHTQTNAQPYTKWVKQDVSYIVAWAEVFNCAM